MVPESSSHTVGLERRLSGPLGRSLSFCLHPTRWAWNAVIFKDRSWGDDIVSSSHTVGWEPRRTCSCSKAILTSHHPTRWAWNMQRVSLVDSIVFGHHPTRWAWNEYEPLEIVTYAFQSSSHTVGLEPPLLPLNAEVRGGHHPTRWAGNNIDFLSLWLECNESSSHTVG